ncbi:asparagine--tRNA ligase [Enterobacteriaceae endosymbiont of Plateumaris consimilis]|uniref:asparagine--tRNA ligase n=1 Tax=Enterobacteriaceae endosymbiont of Plateumaris consimilis TaxID=2675794 RepID=UPI00144964EB|nr:asparagine--tRNA ligase [Enterobacteriaceae endosymbiont of Plateumaris consimilis]QJC28868.1 asparagine--tRNA ligase [Enterobacteriaceae endosymbiont of Plateumaris consimilis]
MLVSSISQLIKDKIKINSEITISGWVRTKRISKSGITFIILYDGSNINDIQVIAYSSLNNYKKEILLITSGCSLTITGKLIKSPKKLQKYEICATQIKVLGWVKNPETYPITPKKHSLEYLRKVSHLRSRTKLISSITRIKHNIFLYIHNFFHKNNFFWINTPLITTLDTEGSGKMFRVSTLNSKYLFLNKHQKIDFKNDFFGKESFLTVSGQLNLESYACSMSKVYTFGPTFRAENSNTNRHLAEFWMLEIEMSFTNLKSIMCLAEKLLKYLCKKILHNHIDEINFLSKKNNINLFDKINKIIINKFIIINYTHAIDILIKNQKNFNNSVLWGKDLSIEHEKYLTNDYFNAPVIVYNYPKEIKAFYMYLNEDNKTVSSMDILFPDIGEIIGGSQREHRINILDDRINELKLNKKDYWWYRDLRKYGTVIHSGFGLGFERFVAYITGSYNIRDVIPFPRTPYNAKF